jgi:hypothetical protein
LLFKVLINQIILNIKNNMSAVGLGDNAIVGEIKVETKVECGTITCGGDITCDTGTQTLKTVQADSLFLTTGQLDINGLATSNPGISGRVWNDGGTLKIA